MTEVLPAAAPRRPRLFPAALVFVLLGPVIGGLLFWGFVAAYGGGTLEPYLRALGVVVFLSYIFGGVQALLTGIGTVLLVRRFGRTAFWHPLAVVVVIHLAAFLCVIVTGWLEGKPITPAPGFLFTISPLLSLASAAICWFIARPLLRAR